MPKRKTARGRRGGGGGRKAAQATAAEGEETEMKDSSQDNSFEPEAAEDSLSEDLKTEPVNSYIQSPKQEKGALETEPYSDLKKNVTSEEEKYDSGLRKETVDKDLQTVAENCQELKENKETISLKEVIEIESQATGLEGNDLAGKENQEEDWSVVEQLEDELLGTVDAVGDNEGALAEECGDQTEMEEIQYIDEEASEDQQLSKVTESNVNLKTCITENAESNEETDTAMQGESTEDFLENVEKSIEPLKVSSEESQKAEEVENNKFEEISEGSINQDQEELAVEEISDVEIIVEPSVPKKTQNKKNVKAQKEKTKYKGAESLEEVFFATENDDVKIMAEDKDNDDISDASLSDHSNANLSLEEISDDDLEPSKKKKKPSVINPIKTEKTDESTKPDVEDGSKSEGKSNGTKTSHASVTVTKRSASDDIDGNSNKRFKPSSDIKSSENVHVKTENDPDASGDLKKEGKKPQTKEIESSHTRSIPQKGNPSHSSKNEPQESRERSLPSRDFVEHKRRYVLLVTSASQTEPQQLKGKIVQCNITPVKSVLEPRQVETFSDHAVTPSKLLNKFKLQLPCSIPEKIFFQVTSVQPPQKENIYSFSMGPVTLSDMDCPKFREVLRGHQEFNLAFDKHCQGILKATIDRHEHLASLISKLKCLELGNRYMIMSVVYKYGSEKSVEDLKATLMFMYEQDIQMESQRLASDGQVRAKLCLKGVPQGVSKDFIQLLFPEALNVSTGAGSLTERTVTLGFSNIKMVEEILSCYELLIISGSQINISQIESPPVLENLLTDATVDSEVVVIEDTKQTEEISETQSSISLTSKQDPEIYQQLNKLKTSTESCSKNEIENSNQNEVITQPIQIKPEFHHNDLAKDELTENVTDAQGPIKEDVKPSLPETAVGVIHSVEDVKIDAGNIEDNSSALKQSGDEKVNFSSDKNQNEGKETVVVLSTIENADNKTVPGTELAENSSIPNDSADNIFKEDTNIDTREEKICEEIKKNVDEKTVIVVEKEAGKESDENLEDVSDEEMLNQSKNEDFEDVVIVMEDSSQWVAASIDLTNEESNSPGKLVNESTKDVSEERSQQAVVQNTKISDKVDTASGKDKNKDPKLVMTDGGLEVSMEVIDVDEDDEKEHNKVIYARTWRPSQDRSKERSSWYGHSYKPVPYVQMPVRENLWSHTSKPEGYYSSREPYKHYENKERAPRHYYPRSSREKSPRYRVPERRRDSYAPKHPRNHSPPPGRDLSIHGHSSSRMSSYRTSTNEPWDKHYDNWHPSMYGEPRRTESYSREAGEASGRQMYMHSHSSAQHLSHAWPDDHAKQSDRYIHTEHRHDYKKSRSRSYSDMSISSDEHFSPVRKSSYRRESPKRPILHPSRSPISVSSRSRSLSPVSKSPSVDYSHAEAGKEELVQTVKHFLELAKGIQQAQKRQSNRSRSTKSPSLRHSKSPLRGRPRSPYSSASILRKAVRSSRHVELPSSPRIRSRSPSWSRNSRSPSYTRSHRFKYKRSPSPSSHGDKKHYERRRSPYHRDSESPGYHYETKKGQKPKDSSQPREDMGIRSKSGQWSETKSRNSSDQPWQQPSAGYQPPQGSGSVPPSNIYNPSYPPPNCPPPNLYSGSSAPVYQYNNPSQFNYSNFLPPPYIPPPGSAGQSYQSSYPIYQPSQPYSSTGHHNAPLQTGTSGSLSSSSKNKKSWSVGNNATSFNKGDKKTSSGTIEKIEDRERLERPKYTKPERVLAKVPMEKK